MDRIHRDTALKQSDIDPRGLNECRVNAENPALDFQEVGHYKCLSSLSGFRTRVDGSISKDVKLLLIDSLIAK